MAIIIPGSEELWFLFTNMQKKVLTPKLQEGCEVSDVMYQMKMRLGLLTTLITQLTL